MPAATPNIVRILAGSFGTPATFESFGDVAIWLCLPFGSAGNSGATSIAALIERNRKIYVEFSYSLWDARYPQFLAANKLGADLNTPGANVYYQGASWGLFRALQVFAFLEGVLGLSVVGTQVLRVFSVGGNLDLTTQALETVYHSEQWNPHHQKIDVLATQGPKADVAADAIRFGIPLIGYPTADGYRVESPA